MFPKNFNHSIINQNYNYLFNYNESNYYYRQLNRRLHIDNLSNTFYPSLTSLARYFCKQIYFCKQKTKTLEMTDDTQAEMISMSYSELECIDQEDIIMLVDVESALKICQECLENNTNSSFDVLSLWFNKLLRAYMDEAICCFNAVKEMCEWFQMMVRLENPLYTTLNTFIFRQISAESSDTGNNLKALLREALRFLTDYKDHLLSRDERMVHGMVFLLFAMVQGFFDERLDAAT